MQSLKRIKTSAIARLNRHIITTLTHGSTRRFGAQTLTDKFPETSNTPTDDDEIELDPLLNNSVSAKKSSSSSSSLNHESDTHSSTHSRIPVYHNDKVQLICNASSPQQIWDQVNQMKAEISDLSILKTNHRSISSRQKASIMDILDSIASGSGTSEAIESFPPSSSSSPALSEQDMRQLQNSVRDVYSAAMRRCIHLRERQTGLELFEEAKKTQFPVSSRIFVEGIRLTIDSNTTTDGMNKCMELFEGMSFYRAFRDGHTYAEMIRAAMMVKHTKRAWKFVKAVIFNEDEDLKKKLLRTNNLRFEIARYFAKTRGIKKGLEFLQDLTEMFGAEAYCDKLYAITLSGMSSAIKIGDVALVEAAEKLFKQSFKTLGRAPNASVFNSLMQCYCSAFDIASAVEMISAMKTKQAWPDPDAVSFMVCVHGLRQYDTRPGALQPEQGWKHVDDIVALYHQMLDTANSDDRKSDSGGDIAVYASLFNLCSGSFCNKGDLQRLYAFYEDQKMRNVPVTVVSANAMLVGGLDYFVNECASNPSDREKLKEDAEKFVEWALSEYDANGLTPSDALKQRVQQRLASLTSDDHELEIDNGNEEIASIENAL